MTQSSPCVKKLYGVNIPKNAINTTQGLPLRKNYLFINSKLAKVPGKNYLLAQLITTFSRRPILEIPV